MRGLITAAVTRLKSLLAASSGSSLVGTIASGTGAVARTVQSKLREVQISVTDFIDADPTGVVDSLAAFNRAAAAATATGQVAIPPGTWNLSAATSSCNWMVDAKATFTGAGSLTGRMVQFSNAAASSKGGRIGSQTKYVETVRPNSETASEWSALSTNGLIGLLGGSRTLSQTSPGSMSTIGVLGYALNDNAAQVSFAYAGYFEGRREAGAGTTHGIEVDSVNRGSVVDTKPYAIGQTGITPALWLASGGGAAGVVDATAAIGIVNNGARFRKGIIFADDAIFDDGAGKPAIVMAAGHKLAWYSDTTSERAAIRSDATAASMSVVFVNSGINVQTIAGTNIFTFNTSGTIGIVGAGKINSTGAFTLDVPSLVLQNIPSAATVGAAGAASALPANPLTYMRFTYNGTAVKIPLYNE